MQGKLFKYRGFNMWTLRCLTEAEVWYAQPSSFNDPLDCRPSIEVDLERATLEKLYYRLMLRRMEKNIAYQKINYLRYLSSEYGDYKSDAKAEECLVRMLARGIKDEVNAEIGMSGVLSLSATWSSARMWSHYADEHRGICIEYDTTEQDHPQLMPVNYRASRAIKTSDLWRWKANDEADAKERVLQTYFYSKSSEWKYEKEWRDRRDVCGAHNVPFRITAIHFGLRCDNSIITSVVKLLNNRPAIKLYRVRPRGDTFRLSRFLLDRDETEAVGVSDPVFLMFKDVAVGEVDFTADEVAAEDPALPA
ncbi:MAG: hypothetical protein RL588_1974 [Pseudomonadota bacterium]